ncbi:MAG: hypothetical protein D6763_09155 [Alphaproteobacteria bacterium]|nr:MAG: hypothetical protein D6763_09155 [Alphaproteobacteria bacterium]
MTEDTVSTETIVADRFAVDLSTPLPEFDTVGGTAYAASDLVSVNRPVYALVQRLGVPRRESVVGKLLGRPVPGLVSPRGEGVMTATDRDGHGQRLVTIFDRPTGGRVIPDPGGFPAFKERALRSGIIPQLAETLSILESRGIAHRSISVRQLYYRAPGSTEIVLAECCSEPPGYNQSPGYEPIERAGAIPEGRGEGDPGCDMYALGVMLLSLYVGRDVADAAAEEGLLEARIRVGSFWALAGHRDLSGALGDLVRGLMEDNPTKRWTAAEVKSWLDGMVPRKTVGDMGWALARPISFGDRTYKDRRALAMAFLNHPGEALELVYGDKFLHWAENALAEGPSREWLERALDRRGAALAREGNRGTENMALARVAAVLFPEGPICFGRIKVCADGFGPALAMAYASGDDGTLNDFKSLMERGRLGALVEILSGRNTAQATAVARLGSLHKIAADSRLGLGLERVLYELNKSLPCLSPKVREVYVDGLRKLLLGLEAAAAKGDLGINLVDRHIGAFIARQSDAFETALARLENSSQRPELYMFETLRLFGALQQKYYPHPLKQVAGGFRAALKRAVDQFKSKSRRKQVLDAVGALLDQGNLVQIARDLNIAALRSRDQKEFRNASDYYRRLSRALEQLERPFTAFDPRMRALGNQYMAYVAVLVLLIATSLVLATSGAGA